MARSIWRTLDAVFALLFAIAVVVQFNDPDPLKWVLIHAAAAWASLLSALGRVTRLLPLAVAAAALLWAAMIVPRVVGQVPFGDMFADWEMQNAGVEESREMYGLLLIALWMSVVAMRARRAVKRPSLVVFAVLCSAPGCGAPPPLTDAAATRTIETAEVEFAEPFTSVSSVRVLRDGRVLVADSREKVLQLVDVVAQTAQPVGRVGGGPGEYALPSRLIALAGDTTLLADPVNLRYLAILPDGTPGQTIAFSELGNLPRGSGHKGADDRGRLYFESGRAEPGGLTSPTIADVIRMDLRTGQLDTLASLALPAGRVEGASMLPGGLLRVLNSKPFALEDVAAVAPDGRVAIVRAADYHVEWISPDGAHGSGPPVAYARIAVTKDEQDAFLASQTRPGQIVITGPAGGGASRAPAAPRAVPAPKGGSPIETTPIEWPDYKAPFLSNAAVVADDGRLWVLRTRAHNESVPRYDVFDAGGVLVQHIALPERTKLVAFGAGVVWLARTDADDLQWLGRYRY